MLPSFIQQNGVRFNVVSLASNTYNTTYTQIHRVTKGAFVILEEAIACTMETLGRTKS